MRWVKVNYVLTAVAVVAAQARLIMGCLLSIEASNLLAMIVTTEAVEVPEAGVQQGVLVPPLGVN